MRNRAFTIACVITFLATGRAGAQTTPPAPAARNPEEPAATTPTGSANWIDFGVRVSDISGDPARYQRFRDLGDGLFLETFRQSGEKNGWEYEAAADHAFRRDQRYVFNAQKAGRFGVSFEWDQIPLLLSQDTKTLYNEESPGVLRIDDAIQQAAAGQITNLIPFLGDARQFELGSRRDTALLRAWFEPTQNVDAKFALKSWSREGNTPYGGSFGFGLSTELPAPIDQRTTDLDSDIEWSNGRALVGGGYHGSWFDNHVPTLIWDNPLQLTDTRTAPSQGRMALWPDSTYHVVNARTSISLPSRSRLSAFLSLGTMRQNDALLPHTINTALPEIPLERTTADAEARTAGANVSFTTRPSRRVAVDARYQLSDFDNRTPEFPTAGEVAYDTSVTLTPGAGPEFYSIKRHDGALDVTFMPARFPTFRVGWRGEIADRAERIYERTTENTLRLSMDALTWTKFTLRALYENGKRSGEDQNLSLLTDVGEQPGMRHYDVAERDRQRFTLQATATPAGWMGLNGSVAVGKDDYTNDGEFGLRDNTNRIYTVGATFMPRPQANVDISYGLEKYAAFSTSRQASAGPQFLDPSRNWGTDQDDNVHTVMADIDLVQIFYKTDLRLGYDFSRSRSTYVYSVGVITDRTLPEVSAPVPALAPPTQLPPVKVQWTSLTADARYHLSKRFALGLSYWFEDYNVEDFALANPRIAINDLPGAILLGYRYRPYTAHTIWLRLLAFW